MSRLDEIKARAEAATLGPWHAWDRGIGWEVHKGEECAPGGRSCDALNGEFRDTFTREDAEFIAAAREDVPWLIERIGELNGAICWDTTCLNCSSLLDSNYDQYMRAEIAEAEVARLTAERDALAAQVARVEALAEEWEREADDLLRNCYSGRDVFEAERTMQMVSELRAVLAGSEADTGEQETGHRCEPYYSRAECGQCGWQEQWCVTCSRQMCGCATGATDQDAMGADQ